MKRFAIAISLALPGIAWAMAAKPLLLGEGALFAGIALAFVVPFLWIVARTA